jgi:hypothetical protein
MQYRLKFLNSLEHAVRALDIEAPDDDAAIELSCMHCIRANMAVELCEGDRHVTRMTPMTARLYLPDDRIPRLRAP